MNEMYFQPDIRPCVQFMASNQLIDRGQEDANQPESKLLQRYGLQVDKNRYMGHMGYKIGDNEGMQQAMIGFY